MNMYSNGAYLSNNPSWDIEDSSWKANEIIKLLKKNNLSPGSICEIGCGAGEILRCLLREYSDKLTYTGYEISEDAFKIIRTKDNNGIEFKLEDAFNDNRKYDVVLAIDVIEHVEEVYSFLRKIKQKGVYKVFHIPLDLSALQVLRGWPLEHARRTIGHLHYFTKGTALLMLQECGLEIIDHFYTFGQFNRPRSLKAYLFGFIRKIFFRNNSHLAVRALGGASLMVLAK